MRSEGITVVRVGRSIKFMWNVMRFILWKLVIVKLSFPPGQERIPILHCYQEEGMVTVVKRTKAMKLPNF